MSLILSGTGERELSSWTVPTARVCCCVMAERFAGMVKVWLELSELIKRVPEK